MKPMKVKCDIMREIPDKTRIRRIVLSGMGYLPHEINQGIEEN